MRGRWVQAALGLWLASGWAAVLAPCCEAFAAALPHSHAAGHPAGPSGRDVDATGTHARSLEHGRSGDQDRHCQPIDVRVPDAAALASSAREDEPQGGVAAAAPAAVTSLSGHGGGARHTLTHPPPGLGPPLYLATLRLRL
ncbi:MAG: hypothetical protein GWO02_08995 [Gammaproteobacteria bacterium]|nr:hypothetical protein [Gammaproteobacteria bacterium]